MALNDTLPSRLEDSLPLVIPFAQLLVNDSPGQNETNQSLTIVSVANAVGGSAVISSDTVVFTPAPNYYGPATFSYVIQDNGTTSGLLAPLTDIGSVLFTVIEVNDPPLTRLVHLGNIAEDSPPLAIPIESLVTNDSPGPANEAGQSLNIIAVNGAIGGSVTLTETNVIFTPAANFFGSGGFHYLFKTMARRMEPSIRKLPSSP